MGYIISYNQETIKRAVTDNPKRRNRKAVWIVSIALIFISLISVFRVTNVFVPGDPAVTKSAVNCFRGNLENEQGVVKAFQTFCEEIISGAELS